MKWRFLIIEDKPDIAKQIEEACPRFVAPDEADSRVCRRFKDAIPLLDSEHYDVVIIDLKDDDSNLPDDENLPGLGVFEEIKKRRFVPVVFYTALPGKVPPFQTAFVRVVEKTEGLTKLEAEIRAVFKTHLPALSRHLEREQREYLWEFLTKHWKEMVEFHDKVDLVYLVARRLAQTLRSDSIREFVESISAKPAETAKTLQPTQSGKEKTAAKAAQDPPMEVAPYVVHPIELYIYPCTSKHWLAGDIFAEGDTKSYWMVLTPSCDFAWSRAEHVILAKCEQLRDAEEYTKWVRDKEKSSNTILNGIKDVIGDNRGSQRERFKFLPGTFFLPDLVVDFQQIRSVPLDALKRTDVIASLDSPFAEAVLARFSRYFGRLGTPDVDRDIVLKRLEASKPAMTKPGVAVARSTGSAKPASSPTAKTAPAPVPEPHATNLDPPPAA